MEQPALRRLFFLSLNLRARVPQRRFVLLVPPLNATRAIIKSVHASHHIA
jgi:hypothetical protein